MFLAAPQDIRDVVRVERHLVEMVDERAKVRQGHHGLERPVGGGSAGYGPGGTDRVHG